MRNSDHSRLRAQDAWSFGSVDSIATVELTSVFVTQYAETIEKSASDRHVWVDRGPHAPGRTQRPLIGTSQNHRSSTSTHATASTRDGQCCGKASARASLDGPRVFIMKGRHGGKAAFERAGIAGNELRSANAPGTSPQHSQRTLDGVPDE